MRRFKCRGIDPGVVANQPAHCLGRKLAEIDPHRVVAIGQKAAQSRIVFCIKSAAGEQHSHLRIALRFAHHFLEYVPQPLIASRSEADRIELIENQNAGGSVYGEKRLRSSVRNAAELDARGIRDSIVGDAGTFFAETPRRDDVTLVIAKIA